MITLKRRNIKEFTQIYNDFMLKQFPETELKSYKDFVKLLEEERHCYNFYIAQNADTTVGYVLLCKGTNFIWIDYIAVLPQFYSGGFGRKIIEGLKNTFTGINGLYFEVEKPDENDINTIRRIKFYNSCGAKKLDCEYFYPNNSGAIPMDLYFLPVKKTDLGKPEIKENIKEVFAKLHYMCPCTEEILNKIS